MLCKPLVIPLPIVLPSPPAQEPNVLEVPSLKLETQLPKRSPAFLAAL